MIGEMMQLGGSVESCFKAAMQGAPILLLKAFVKGKCKEPPQSITPFKQKNGLL